MDKRTDINTASFAYSVSLLRIRISGYPPGAGTKRQSIHTAVLHGIAVFFCCVPGGAHFLRVQVPNPPGSGKDIVEGKGVAGDCKSEGSRMWGTY